MTLASVAVVIPCRDRGHCIAKSLASVFAQTRPPREVHVIDDGSKDDSVQVIERAFANAGAIRCFLTVRDHRGVVTTRNELCRAVTTDYVAFLDSDDIYAPQRLEAILDRAPREGHFLGFSGIDFHSARSEEDGEQSLAAWHEEYRRRLAQGMSLPTAGFSLLHSHIAITQSNYVISRGLFDAVGGFDSRMHISDDWDFAVQSLPFVEPTFVPEPLMTYRLHTGNISARCPEPKKAQDISRVLDKAAGWMVGPTPNPLAPTPHNWPQLFRIFAVLNQSAAGVSLASRLPREVLLSVGEAARSRSAPAREAEAIRELIASARLENAADGHSTLELMQRCHRQWSSQT